MVLKSVLASLVVLATAQIASAEKILIAPNKSYQGVTNALSSGGSYSLFAGLHEINGKVAVCGLVFFVNPSNTTRQIEKKASRVIQFHLDGKVLNVVHDRFQRYDTEAEAKVGKAGCSVTPRPWADVKDPGSFALKFPSRSKVID